ncbi:MAG: nicotinate-nucleotide--dimethylbenzimidazole phosphoribosyltransferase [Symbiobacteriaceae bacterium]|nr:nicotinate-nucleotide--dimethylbenzimidazole phosphoribosyltransferase [Symbiobacteriaceae bacterium]
MTFNEEALRHLAIPTLNQPARQAAQERLDSLVKPPGSLGRLEDIALQLAAIRGEICYSLGKRCVIIMAADNGVVAEGVSSAPQYITATQTLNFARGITGVAVLAKAFNTDLFIYDVGINGTIDHSGIYNRKIAFGTGNIAQEPAMTRQEALAALGVGVEAVEVAWQQGYELIGVGEMGIGNTTTAAAVLAALTGAAVEEVTGLGAGLSDEGYRRKQGVIAQALALHQPRCQDPLEVLAKLGGFDLAAMVGVFLGGASRGLPVVIDGFISMVAALVAVRLHPQSWGYLFPSHASSEPGVKVAAAALGLEPYLPLGMRLGEGSGCPLMFNLMDAACVVIREMATFAEADIGDEYMTKIKMGSVFQRKES